MSGLQTGGARRSFLDLRQAAPSAPVGASRLTGAGPRGPIVCAFLPDKLWPPNPDCGLPLPGANLGPSTGERHATQTKPCPCALLPYRKLDGRGRTGLYPKARESSRGPGPRLSARGPIAPRSRGRGCRLSRRLQLVRCDRRTPKRMGLCAQSGLSLSGPERADLGLWPNAWPAGHHLLSRDLLGSLLPGPTLVWQPLAVSAPTSAEARAAFRCASRPSAAATRPTSA
jgi:hypothetical protein